MVNQLDRINLSLSDKRRHTDIRFYVKGILGDSYLNYFRKKAAERLKSMTLKVMEIANMAIEIMPYFSGIVSQLLQYRQSKNADKTEIPL